MDLNKKHHVVCAFPVKDSDSIIIGCDSRKITRSPYKYTSRGTKYIPIIHLDGNDINCSAFEVSE